MESFIKSGAFDCFGRERNQLLCAYTQIMEETARAKKNSATGQMSLFDLMDSEERAEVEYTYPEAVPLTKDQILAYEKEVLGIYVSGHPLDAVRGVLERVTTAKTVDFAMTTQDEDKEQKDSMSMAEPKVAADSKQTVGGIITAIRRQFTKNGQEMAFVTLEDFYGTLEVIVFPKTFAECRQYLEPDEKVMISGRVSAEVDRDAKLIADGILPISARKIWIQMEDRAVYDASWNGLLRELKKHPGTCEVVLSLKNEKLRKTLSEAYAGVDEELLGWLKRRFGAENIRIT